MNQMSAVLAILFFSVCYHVFPYVLFKDYSEHGLCVWREDNPRASESGLSPLVNYTVLFAQLISLLHKHAFAICALRDICC